METKAEMENKKGKMKRKTHVTENWAQASK